MSVPPNNLEQLIPWIRVNSGAQVEVSLDKVFKNLDKNFKEIEMALDKKEKQSKNQEDEKFLKISKERRDTLKSLQDALRVNDLFRIFKETQALSEEVKKS